MIQSRTVQETLHNKRRDAQVLASKLRLDYKSGAPIELDDVKLLSMARDANKFRFRVPIEKCVWGHGWRYLPGEHPFINFYFLEESLDEFYQKFCPANFLEGITFDSKNRNKSVPKRFWIDKIIPDTPLCEGGLNEEVYGKKTHGPVHPKKLELEKSRLRTVQKSIRTYGYDPLISDHDLYGHFLVKKDDFLFVVIGGAHRSAALVDLGWTTLPAVFLMGLYSMPRIVSEWNLDFLSGIAYSEEELPIIQTVFHAYFDEDLREKRRRRLGTWMESARAKVTPAAASSIVVF
ncbi:MAG: hypothetical protein JWS08_19960 [Phormidium sp. PBR-2020]|nr:MAG: hypothetical protein JWS08_19960 [Phormidium sp. PBR-2020]